MDDERNGFSTYVRAAVGRLRVCVMREIQEVEDGWCLNLSGLQARTGLSRDLLRGVVADLRHEGLVEYRRGLWSEDGLPAGSGYTLTSAGAAAVEALNA